MPRLSFKKKKFKRSRNRKSKRYKGGAAAPVTNCDKRLRMYKRVCSGLEDSKDYPELLKPRKRSLAPLTKKQRKELDCFTLGKRINKKGTRCNNGLELTDEQKFALAKRCGTCAGLREEYSRVCRQSHWNAKNDRSHKYAECVAEKATIECSRTNNSTRARETVKCDNLLDPENKISAENYFSNKNKPKAEEASFVPKENNRILKVSKKQKKTDNNISFNNPTEVVLSEQEIEEQKQLEANETINEMDFKKKATTLFNLLKQLKKKEFDSNNLLPEADNSLKDVFLYETEFYLYKSLLKQFSDKGIDIPLLGIKKKELIEIFK